MQVNNISYTICLRAAYNCYNSLCVAPACELLVNISSARGREQTKSNVSKFSFAF